MSDPINWEQFKFPIKPFGYYLNKDRIHESTLTLTKDIAPTDPKAPTSTWSYHSESNTLQNPFKHKKISLIDLNSHKKIFRFLAAIEMHYPESECNSIFDAFNQAAYRCYGKNIVDLLEEKKDQNIHWDGTDFNY